MPGSRSRHLFQRNGASSLDHKQAGEQVTQFKRVIPVLKVRDLEETIDFYIRHFGFSLCWRAANDGSGENGMVQLGDISILFSTGAHLGSEPQFSGSIYIDMVGVEEFYEKVKDAVPIVWPLETMDYGSKEFGVRDCNGYTLAFSEAT